MARPLSHFRTGNSSKYGAATYKEHDPLFLHFCLSGAVLLSRTLPCLWYHSYGEPTMIPSAYLAVVSLAAHLPSVVFFCFLLFHSTCYLHPPCMNARHFMAFPCGFTSMNESTLGVMEWTRLEVDIVQVHQQASQAGAKHTCAKERVEHGKRDIEAGRRRRKRMERCGCAEERRQGGV